MRNATRHQTKRQQRSDGTFAFYARHTLDCPRAGVTHSWWEALTPTRDDNAAGFKRCEYLRILPGTDPDYDRVYGMRADAESLNAQLEHDFHKNRLPAWGLANQTLAVLLACVTHNAWARWVWQRELQQQNAPPGHAA